MVPVPRYSLVCRFGHVELVIRPGAILLFGSLAAALDFAYLPTALPHLAPLVYHLAALLIGLLMAALTLLHESGHAVAYRLQGVAPVRITLRSTGGACAALLENDTPGRALLRALAGPVVTTVAIIVLAAMWRVLPLPAFWRIVAGVLTVFSLFDLLSNILPVHPRADGTFALQAVLWLARGQKPEDFVLLYVWRPLALAAAIVLATGAGLSMGYVPPSGVLAALAGWCALALCAVPPAALIYRQAQLGPSIRRL